jgi:hypothetical protein
VSDLANIQRNGLAQTIDGTLAAWGVNDASGSPDGWNVTVQGVTDVPTNKTGVFTERVAATGAAVTAPRQLAAGSLRINSISSAFTAVGSTTGTAPAYDCAPGCAVDSPTPIRVALAAPNAGMGTFDAAAGTTTLNLPSTVKAVRDNNSYQLDLLWTLASGPGTPNA